MWVYVKIIIPDYTLEVMGIIGYKKIVTSFKKWDRTYFSKKGTIIKKEAYKSAGTLYHAHWKHLSGKLNIVPLHIGSISEQTDPVKHVFL